MRVRILVCTGRQQPSDCVPCLVHLQWLSDVQINRVRLQLSNRTHSGGGSLFVVLRGHTTEWCVGQLKAAMLLTAQLCVGLEEDVQLGGEHELEFLDGFQFAGECDAGFVNGVFVA